MNSRLVRMKKEARALFWPWCVVVFAGAAPLILAHTYAEAIGFLSFFAGIPLLASLSLGGEFQHRTLSLWLTQPCSRMQLWAEKLLVMFAAVLSAALVCGIGASFFTWPRSESRSEVALVAFVIIISASAAFWTLVARSTLGGFALSWIQLSLIYVWNPHMILNFELPQAAPLAVVSICYAVLMFVLGARKLARFQVTGGAAGDDLLMTGPSVMPRALADCFRCRPSGAFLNLIRRELRLLRPLWMGALLSVLFLGWLGMFRLLPDPSQPSPRVPGAPHMAVALVILSLLLLAILAGSLSLGEERTHGTHAWQMTLPFSIRRQWLIKIVVAMVSGLVCAVALPHLVLIAVGSIHGSPFMYADLHSLSDGTFWVSLVVLASFLCASAVHGTTQAAVWVFPVMFVIYYAGAIGVWFGQALARTTGTLQDFVVSSFHLSPMPLPIDLSSPVPGVIMGDVVLAFIPVVVLGVIQSHRLFRIHPPEGSLWMLRCVLPLASVSILWCLFLSAGLVSSRWQPFDETRQALDKLLPGTTRLELTGEDLANSSPLNSRTRRWLRGARITVTPDSSHWLPGEWQSSAATVLPSGYLATIHLASGLKCRLVVAHYAGISFSSETASCGN